MMRYDICNLSNRYICYVLGICLSLLWQDVNGIVFDEFLVSFFSNQVQECQFLTRHSIAICINKERISPFYYCSTYVYTGTYRSMYERVKLTSLKLDRLLVSFSFPENKLP